MEYRNAKCISETVIDCEINHPKHGWIPFSCDLSDTGAELDVVALHEVMAADPDTIAFAPPTISELEAEAAIFVLQERNNLLATVVDPIATNALRWGELSDDQKAELSAYRLTLLDVTEQDGYPLDVAWPVVPAWI